ncbi:hypothetical protein ACLOJK_005700 [Asimina triloba]
MNCMVDFCEAMHERKALRRQNGAATKASTSSATRKYLPWKKKPTEREIKSSIVSQHSPYTWTVLAIKPIAEAFSLLGLLGWWALCAANAGTGLIREKRQIPFEKDPEKEAIKNKKANSHSNAYEEMKWNPRSQCIKRQRKSLEYAANRFL